ncbi:hypothetical protein GCM10028813_27490 [Ramlibacter alkalitolerans]
MLPVTGEAVIPAQAGIQEAPLLVPWLVPLLVHTRCRLAGPALPGADRNGAASLTRATSTAEDTGSAGRFRRTRALQDQGVTVRLGDIKEEARARGPHGQRFPSAPGDSRRGGLSRPGPAPGGTVARGLQPTD